jgi:spermidine/putrescine transport system substrate-binding protein
MQTTPRRRRATTASAAVASLALLLAACGGEGSDESAALDPDADLSKQSVVVSNWKEYMPEDIADTFAEATGSKLKVTYHATNEDLVAKVTASDGEGLDVVFGSKPFLQAFADQGLLEPIDTSLVPNWKNLDPASLDKGEPMFAPYTWGTTGICYRSDLVDEAPDSWYDLLEPEDKYKGKVTMMGTDRWAVLPAQKALGYSVNTTDEDEMAKVKDLMTKAKPNLLAYDDTTFYERLVSGEAVMTEAWDGWCNYGIGEDENIKFVVPKEGSDLFMDGMAIMKSSKNKEAAHAFVNTILDAKNHGWISENILYNIPNDAAVALVPKEITDQYETLGTRRDEMLQGESMEDVGEAASLYTQIITEVTAS